MSNCLSYAGYHIDTAVQELCCVDSRFEPMGREWVNSTTGCDLMTTESNQLAMTRHQPPALSYINYMMLKITLDCTHNLQKVRHCPAKN
jgi:hypothetical protein